MKIWRPYTQAWTADKPLSVHSAAGSHFQLESGQRIFDGISSWWLITHGHGHPTIQEAIHRQLKQLHQVVFANFTYPAAEEFGQLLASFLPPHLNRMFFSDNGSTAVEVAMKMAYQYAQQCGHGDRKKFLTFESSYHGDTCGAMSASQRGRYTKNYEGMLFDVVRCRQGVSHESSIDAWTSDFRAKISQHEDQICAILLEPLIQGAGGMVVWPKKAINTICQIAKQKGLLVIFDEVMTGFGRTGSMFAFEQLDLIPDFVCLSKGLTAGFLPMGLTVTRAEIFESFLAPDQQRMLFHGHSFTGNALSCAAALANLQVWRDEDTLNKIQAVGEFQTKALASVVNNGLFQQPRVCGTIAAAELRIEVEYGSTTSQDIFAKCLKKGVYVRPLGSTIYLMPPYCSTQQEIEHAWTVITETVTE